VAAADLAFAEQQRAVDPAALDAILDVRRQVRSAVAPRGNRSIASVTSLAMTAASTSKCRRMRCRSESCSCRIWLSQCTNSTYGLPRSLANTVAPSIAL